MDATIQKLENKIRRLEILLQEAQERCGPDAATTADTRITDQNGQQGERQQVTTMNQGYVMS